MSLTGTATRLIVAACTATLLIGGAALAQGTSAPAPADPVVAKVNGQPIHLSELKDIVETLPDNLRAMPLQKLYPMLLDQLIDGRALLAEAHKAGLEKDPAVQRQMAEAADRVLQTAVLSKQVGGGISDDAVRARYDHDNAGKQGEEEVHARHILVDSEDTAKQIIAQLKGGADFAALAKQYSKDPGGPHQGGDLGFFKKGDMVPEFAAAAFALQPGQYSQTPVHSQFGWHVIQVIERRHAKPLSFEQARSELRQKMVHEAVEKVVAAARAAVTVEKFNLDGSPIRATDTAVPPAPK